MTVLLKWTCEQH